VRFRGCMRVSIAWPLLQHSMSLPQNDWLPVHFRNLLEHSSKQHSREGAHAANKRSRDASYAVGWSRASVQLERCRSAVHQLYPRVVADRVSPGRYCAPVARLVRCSSATLQRMPSFMQDDAPEEAWFERIPLRARHLSIWTMIKPLASGQDASLSRILVQTLSETPLSRKGRSPDVSHETRIML